MLTQQEFTSLKSKIRRLNLKLELLNEDDQILDKLEGITTQGSINLSANGAYRRTGNLTMVLKPQYNLLPSPTSRLWLNKKVKVSMGLSSPVGDISWFDLGRFAISNINVNYNTSESTLSCELVDYMAFLDGTLGGILPIGILIPAGTPLKQAYESVVTELSRKVINILKINSMEVDTPIDIEKPAGSTVYEVLVELTNLYKNFEFYFDIDGFFIVQEIRKKKTDPVVWNFNDVDLSLTQSTSFNFQNVKNSIWVWGAVEDQNETTFFMRNRWSRVLVVELDSLTDKQEGDICYITTDNLSYIWDGTDWTELDFNVDPQLNMEQIGEKIHVIDDDNILDDEQAFLHAKFGMLEYSSLAQTMNFTTVPIYSLRPNTKINLSYPRIGVEGEFLLTDLTLPLGLDSSSITCTKIYY